MRHYFCMKHEDGSVADEGPGIPRSAWIQICTHSKHVVCSEGRCVPWRTQAVRRRSVGRTPGSCRNLWGLRCTDRAPRCGRQLSAAKLLLGRQTAPRTPLHQYFDGMRGQNDRVPPHGGTKVSAVMEFSMQHWNCSHQIVVSNGPGNLGVWSWPSARCTAVP